MYANTSKNELGKNNTGRIIMPKRFLYGKTNCYIRREVTKTYWVFTCVLNTLHTFTLFNPSEQPKNSGMYKNLHKCHNLNNPNIEN